MRRSLCLCCALVGLVAAVGANGQTPFSLSENFNSYAHLSTPTGWTCISNNAAYPPAVFTQDPDGWGMTVDYGASWTGPGRLNLIHPGQNQDGRAAAAWYNGAGAHSGDYPIQLTNQAIRIEFDLILRSGNVCSPADGGVIALMPVTTSVADAVNKIGVGGGGVSWGGLDGLAIEFDVWYNTEEAGLDPPGADQNNHVGLDVYALWNPGGRGTDRLPSLITNVDVVGAGSIPRMVTTGDGGQPVHFTIFYNDPAEGGTGKVRVYLKVDPATGGAGYSYGMDDPVGQPYGIMVLEGCVGAWPAEFPTAVFGVTGSTGGCNAVHQVDNIVVNTTVLSDPGTACDPIDVPIASLPTPVPLNPAGKAADCPATLPNPAVDGWDVKVYSYVRNWNNYLGPAAYWLQYAETHGLVAANLHAQKDVNYADVNGCGGHNGGKRQMPGVNSADYYGAVFKGWICFPEAKDYFFNVSSDDGFCCVIGTGTTNQVIGYFDAGRGCDAGTTFGVTVSEPGVYPIQIIYWEGGGGSGIEFSRVVAIPDQLLLGPKYVLVGNTRPEGMPDHPVIYGSSLGAIPMDILASVPPHGVDVLASQKIQGAVVGGEQKFNLKVVKAPTDWSWGGMAYDEEGDEVISAQRMLEAMPNVAYPVTTASGLNYTDWTIHLHVTVSGSAGNWTYSNEVWDAPYETEGGMIPNNEQFPGITPVLGPIPWGFDAGANPGPPASDYYLSADGYGVKAWGYANFPRAGRYYLWLRSDDNFTLKLGNQTIYSGAGTNYEALPINLAEAGVYAITVEFAEFGGDAYLEFGEATYGDGMVVLNTATDPNAITVWTEATIPADAPMPEPRGIRITADRKVANVGQEGELGWNAKLVKELPEFAALVAIDGDYRGTALAENSLASIPVPFGTELTDTSLTLNYSDHGTDGITRASGIFTASNGYPDRDVNAFDPSGTVILPTAENEDFVVSATGYILFPEAGAYALNINGDDGGNLWIAGQRVTWFRDPTGPRDYWYHSIWVDEPGLYDIRADVFERGGGFAMEVFQYIADPANPAATKRVLINGGSTVSVYRTLTAAPASTAHANPVRLPASASAGRIKDAADPGFKVQTVNATFNISGYGDWDWDRNVFRDNISGTELLDAVLLGIPSLNEQGTMGVTAITETVDFGDNTFPGMSGFTDPNLVTGTNEEDFAVRVTGYLALTKGGHVLSVSTDDGFKMWMGGTTPHLDGNVVGESGPLKGASERYFYVVADQDGLYKFEIDMNERGGGEDLHFKEFIVSIDGTITPEIVNVGNAAKVFQTVTPCPIPFADTDGDTDVDQSDFGVWQQCFTGDAGEMAAGCSCLDQDDDGLINATDFAAFQNCYTGPEIPWTATANCPG
ncbi:MAG: hypothetical protein KA354_04525 [Phycisphaerae bacterium]|nr:hypothetical protein [Phycisphaerae bacterium]